MARTLASQSGPPDPRQRPFRWPSSDRGPPLARSSGAGSPEEATFHLVWKDRRSGCEKVQAHAGRLVNIC